MIIEDNFKVSNTTFTFKKDEYPLSKIKGVRVKTNTFQDHALRIVCIGLVVASVVWIICPESFGLITAPLALTVGMFSALFSVRKYELQVEFQHIDETGLQWVSVSKTNSKAVKNLFEKQVSKLLELVT
ncbi:hypothetical protein C1S86_24770 [Vibrio parahaemolyticus]|uniref:DUF6232 family protein n=1 Tax=Vibrio parahaemolyticus TaxID=670 RepID=UPI0009944D21|nr:DUF6232 family protein [Vibrio parahaemolyticus]OOQ67397.1 hypothetical protein BSR61_24645 [Vibrio parahaemolyticus]PMT73812.1 hypothetical protein C1S97_25665 [Vibrio parahaemolyticus]PMT78987.1 hypothetical protein C1S86_24770 [Vibrio parahaemolyticus]